MPTGDFDHSNLEDQTATSLREVEIVAGYPHGTVRMGHPGVPTPRYETYAIERLWLDRTELDAGLYVLLATDAGKAAVGKRHEPDQKVSIAAARQQVQAAFDTRDE